MAAAETFIGKVNAPNINIFLGHVVIDFLVRRGVRGLVLSPGSRSGPLAVAATDHPEVELKVVIDERAAAYYACGRARGSGQPAAVICTSGTAAANFLPAVVESYHSHLPVILITADRPCELQNCGANQAINQAGLYGVYAKSLTLEAPDNDLDAGAVLLALDKAFRESKGPVHLNCRFREPLAPLVQKYPHTRLRKETDKWWEDRKRRDIAAPIGDMESAAVRLADRMKRVKAGMIVAGPQLPHEKSLAVLDLAEKCGWPIAADILSPPRFAGHSQVCTAYDLYLDAADSTLRPDMILHLGGLPTSKRLNQFLWSAKGIEYVKIQDHERTIDPDRLETNRIIASPDEFLTTLGDRLDTFPPQPLTAHFLESEKRCRQILETRFSDGFLSGPALAWTVGRHISASGALFLSSSLPVREAESFMITGPKDLMVGANRGASGIDGVVASACGFAAGTKRSVTLIIGDLALLHDLNSLKLAAESPYPICIVAINNNGGGIFEFLPISGYEGVFEKYFAAPTNLDFESAARLFDLSYFRPKTLGEFSADYMRACGQRLSALIEVVIDRKKNVMVHEQIGRLVRQNV